MYVLYVCMYVLLATACMQLPVEPATLLALSLPNARELVQDISEISHELSRISRASRSPMTSHSELSANKGSLSDLLSYDANRYD
jgi:hypothetical protein